MEEFDIPVEDFEAIKKLILIGQPAVAIAKFQQTAGTSRENAEAFIEQLTDSDPELKAAADALNPSPPPPPSVTAPPTAVSDAPVPQQVQPPIPRRKKSWRDVSDDHLVFWYHHALGLITLPLAIIGGLSGLFCLALGYIISFKLFQSRLLKPAKYGLSIAGSAAVVALYFGVVAVITGQGHGGIWVGWPTSGGGNDAPANVSSGEPTKTADSTKPETGTDPATSGPANRDAKETKVAAENKPSSEQEELFNTEIPDLSFPAEDGPLPILETAAESVNFTLTESARERTYFKSRSDREFETATPNQLIEDFEKVSGRKVLIDYAAKKFDVK